MTKRIAFVIITLGAIVAYMLYQNFYNVDPVKAWTQQAEGTWVISDENGSAELSLDADGHAHFYSPVLNDQPEIDARGEWRVSFATEELAILELIFLSGLESWLEEINSNRSEDEHHLVLDQVFVYLERDESGTVSPVMIGTESLAIGWTPFRDSNWEPTTEWEKLLVGYWNAHYMDGTNVATLDPAALQLPDAQPPASWNTEIRPDGTWNWRLDTDIGTWKVLHDLGEYAVVEFVETGDSPQRILTFQKLLLNGTINTIMFTGYGSDKTLADYYTFERVK